MRIHFVSHTADCNNKALIKAVDPIKENIRKLVKDINEQCDESFRVVMDGDYCTLYNEVKITEGSDFEIEARLKQIAKENGTV
jgi:hypothetical protein